MPLGFILFEHLLDLFIEMAIDTRQALSNVLMYRTLRDMKDTGGVAHSGIIFNDIFREPDRSFFGQSFQTENPPCIVVSLIYMQEKGFLGAEFVLLYVQDE